MLSSDRPKCYHCRFLVTDLAQKVGFDNQKFEPLIPERDPMTDAKNLEISSNLVQMIRCPVTKSDLSVASEQVVLELNKQIESRKLLNQLGQVVEVPIESGFVNHDRSLLLPVRSGIVILIADQAIPLGNTSV